MFRWSDDTVKKHLFSGEFGLEKEGLRVTADGRFAHTPDPFAGNERIVRDFSENQTEINTGVHTTEEGALDELADLTALIHRTLDALPEKEYLWPFSNPPYIRNERDIPIAVYPPEQAGKRIYREYLSDRYGRYKMAFSGIHVNYSFSDELLRAAYEARSDEAGREAAGESADAADDRAAQEDFRRFRDELYLKLAEDLARYGWIVTALTAASPVMDGSYVEKGKTGKDTFLGMASVRCSELGYWNHFAPVFDYTSLKGYIRGVRQYVEKGYLAFPSELYYPIRVKPRGANSLELLEERGVNHIELRMVDLNPFEYSGMDIRDLKFIRYLLI